MADLISLLPEENATPAMRAQSLTSAERRPIPIELLATLWDPWHAPAARLPSLAADLSVDLWDEGWGDLKKRDVIAQSPAMHRLKGTIEGIRRHLAVVDATLVDHITPPQRFFATRDLTRDEWQSWLERLPQIRVYLGSDSGTADHGFFAGDGVAAGDDEIGDFVLPDGGRALYGRRATLYRDGAETSIRMVDSLTKVENRPALDIEVFRVPGRGGDAIFATAEGPSFVGTAYAGGEEQEPDLYTARFERIYLERRTELRPTTIDPGLDPITAFSERVSVAGNAGWEFHAGDQASAYFAGPNRAPWLLHDRLHLNDKAVLAPVTDAFSFAGISRVSMSPFTVELLAQAAAPLPLDAFVVGVSFAGRAHTLEPDHRAIEAAMDAVDIAKAHRDSVAISFAVTRLRTFDDGIPLDGSFQFGAARVANIL